MVPCQGSSGAAGRSGGVTGATVPRADHPRPAGMGPCQGCHVRALLGQGADRFAGTLLGASPGSLPAAVHSPQLSSSLSAMGLDQPAVERARVVPVRLRGNDTAWQSLAWLGKTWQDLARPLQPSKSHSCNRRCTNAHGSPQRVTRGLWGLQRESEQRPWAYGGPQQPPRMCMPY